MNQKNKNIKFIRANEKHIGLIYNLESETLPNDIYSKNTIIENIANKQMLNFIEKVDDEFIGYACLSFFEKEGELLKISIRKEFQNKGMGYQLLKKIVEEAKENGVEKIFLEVRENNISATNFYKKFGFKVISLRNAYYSDGTNAVIMEYNNV